MRCLRESWVQNGPRVETHGDVAEIDRLLKHELEKLGEADGGWRILYRRRTDRTLWELSYPESHNHGGGPRMLRELEISEPADWR